MSWLQSNIDVVYVGPDIPEIWLWHGHPGRVDEVITWLGEALEEVALVFYGGPTLTTTAQDLEPVEAEVVRDRRTRLRSGLHPVEEMWIGLPVVLEPDAE